MMRYVAVCAILCAGCGGALRGAPSGGPVVSAPSPVVKPRAPQAPFAGRHDTAYDRAEARCLDIWQSLGYAVDLHETPEYDWGVQCVLEGADDGMCEEVGGRVVAMTVCVDTGEPACAMCLVDVPYRAM